MASTVALGRLVLQLTGSGLGVAGVVVAEILPVLLLAPVAGALVDRFSRRRAMILADLVRAVLTVALPFVSGHVGAVYAIAAGMSAGAVFFNPAAGASLPALVGRDRLVAANSGIWTAAVLSQIALAPITGLVVTVAGLNIAFWANAASYLASAALLTRLPALTPAADTEAQPTAGSRWRTWWANGVRGVRHISHDRRLRALAIGQTLAALSAGATGAIGVGAAAGPLLLVRRIRNPAQPGWMFGPFAVRGGVDLVLASVTTLPPAAAALAVYGLGTSTGAVTFNSLLRATVPDAVRGRVMAAFDITWQAGRLASLGIGGLLADQLGIRAVYYLGGILLILAASLAPLARTRPVET